MLGGVFLSISVIEIRIMYTEFSGPHEVEKTHWGKFSVRCKIHGSRRAAVQGMNKVLLYSTTLRTIANAIRYPHLSCMRLIPEDIYSYYFGATPSVNPRVLVFCSVVL